MSTIKSSAENLTLNADGANNDIIFQSNGSTQLTLQGSDGSIGIGITTPVGDSARTLHLSDNTGIGFGTGANGRPDFQIQTADGVRLGFICGEGSSTEDIVMLTSGVLCTPQGIELGSGIDGTASNILDDYEEGNWTPTAGAGLTVVGTFSSTGKYTKIGRQVTVEGTVAGVTSVAVPTANSITISSLPFANAFARAVGVASNEGITASAGTQTVGTNIYFDTTVSATATIRFNTTYIVSV